MQEAVAREEGGGREESAGSRRGGGERDAKPKMRSARLDWAD